MQKDTVDMARDILEGRSAVKGQQRSRGGVVGEVVEVRLKGVPRQNLPHPGLYGRRVRLKREKREGKTTKKKKKMKMKMTLGGIGDGSGDGSERGGSDSDGEGGESKVAPVVEVGGEEGGEEEEEEDEYTHTYVVECPGEEGGGLEWRSWRDASTYTRKVNIIETQPKTCFFDDAAGTGEVADKAKAVAELVKGESAEVVRRVLYYIAHNRPVFKMNNVSRDGGTQNGPGNFTVSSHDSEAFMLLLRLSTVASNALRRDPRRRFVFKVADTTALTELRALLRDGLGRRRGDCEESSDGSRRGSGSGSGSGSNGGGRWPEMTDGLNRQLLDYQTATVKRMLVAKQDAHFLNIRVGLGKTLIFLTYLKERGLDADARHVVYTMPRSAFGGVVREILEMGLDVDMIVGGRGGRGGRGGKTKSRPSKAAQEHAQMWETVGRNMGRSVRIVRSVEECFPFRVIVVEHDTLQIVKEDLLPIMHKAVFAVDEVHKCLASTTLRTGATLELAKAALETVAFTGTPVLNAGSGAQLIPYMEMLVPFYVHPRNFIVAANAMVAFRVDTGVGKREVTIDPWGNLGGGASSEDGDRGSDGGDGGGDDGGDDGGGGDDTSRRSRVLQQEHDRLLDSGKKEGLREAVSMCHEAATPVMVRETVRRLSEGVLLVAASKTHQQELAKLVLRATERGYHQGDGARGVGGVGGGGGSSSSRSSSNGAAVTSHCQVFCMAKRDSGFPLHPRLTVRPDIHLTNSSVEQGREADFRVVIVRSKQCEGYTVTRLGAMVSSVYFGNQATREQLKGRIDRITQVRGAVPSV